MYVPHGFFIAYGIFASRNNTYRAPPITGSKIGKPPQKFWTAELALALRSPVETMRPAGATLEVVENHA